MLIINFCEGKYGDETYHCGIAFINNTRLTSSLTLKSSVLKSQLFNKTILLGYISLNKVKEL